ncbi:hypothetical protein [Micromonospora sp. NPDC001898]|uniref:hypothetical protein n=1 Tax=Micromonospora sp. NPDC001898 TaxID=3364221 RepID=UPI00367C9D29
MSPAAGAVVGWTVAEEEDDDAEPVFGALPPEVDRGVVGDRRAVDPAALRCATRADTARLPAAACNR